MGAVKFIVMADIVMADIVMEGIVMAAREASTKSDIGMDGVTATGVIGTASGIASASAIVGAIRFATWREFAGRAGTSI
jgi:hypothetical protein